MKTNQSIHFSYAQQAKVTSDRYRDQLRSPLETGIHWVEHVAKNNGAPHLRCVAVELPFYQLYNLDCWAFVLIALYLTVIVLNAAIRMAISNISTQSKLKRS